MNATISAAQVQRITDELNAWFIVRVQRITALADEMMGVLRLDDDGRISIGDATRRRLKGIAVSFLAVDETIDGCGLIFARSAVGSNNGHLEWWVHEDEARFARYSFGVVPGADRYYDYEHHEWFIHSFNEGTPALVGPYIDYLGVESYVLTLTVPAVLDGVRVGAAGNDIEVADLEAELLPILLREEAPLAVVGRHGNVLVSNSPELLPGDHIAADAPEFARVRLEPESAGLHLLYAAGAA
ncbi:MAG: PDC sensor domain-containing protein [Actinobacteria bacterium]|nr:PDC sensor domain-containing protein [Actinomycetota bacterium]